MKQKWTTVRLKQTVLDDIRKIAKEEQRSIPTIIERVIKLYKNMVQKI